MKSSLLVSVLAALLLSACDAPMTTNGRGAGGGGGNNHSFVLDKTPTVDDLPVDAVPDPDYDPVSDPVDYDQIQDAAGDNTSNGGTDFGDIQDAAGDGAGASAATEANVADETPDFEGMQDAAGS